jgi:hypothetical protein
MTNKLQGDVWLPVEMREFKPRTKAEVDSKHGTK